MTEPKKVPHQIQGCFACPSYYASTAGGRSTFPPANPDASRAGPIALGPAAQPGVDV